MVWAEAGVVRTFLGSFAAHTAQLLLSSGSNGNGSQVNKRVYCLSQHYFPLCCSLSLLLSHFLPLNRLVYIVCVGAKKNVAVAPTFAIVVVVAVAVDVVCWRRLSSAPLALTSYPAARS